MDKKTTCLIVLSLFSIIFSFRIVQGQIMITSGEEVTAEDLVENIIGEGVQYFNVQYQGADTAKGTFTNGLSTNLGIQSGIILTSGYASILEGPNYSCSATGNNGYPGNATMNMICIGSTTFDACVLEFDVIPEMDTLRFTYVFGSEEYDEFVNSTFNDVFGIFVTGPNPEGGFYMNEIISTVPGYSDLLVKINNVNNGNAPCQVEPTGPCTNCEYYVSNTNGLTIEYDGFTTVLTAWVKVVPCEAYHVLIGVADEGDVILDSGVCLEENSITFPGIDVKNASNIPGYPGIIEGCSGADIVFKLPNASYSPVTINFQNVSGSGYAINGIDYTDENGDFIEPFVILEEGEDSVSIYIIPVQDNMPEGDEIIEFIVENTLGCEIRYDTVSLVIQDYIAMTDTISPPQVMCECQEDSTDMWVHVSGGIPPYSYLWEPGGQTTDTIWVSPDTTTTYIVSYNDLCGESSSDSTYITVLHHADFETYYFEAALNTELDIDVYGEVLDDTVFVLLPPGTNPSILIASYTFTNEMAAIFANYLPQESGVTPNDFTYPILYMIYGSGGSLSEWTVIAEVEVGQNENFKSDIQIFPNPAKDKLNIHNANGFKVSLVSNLGTEVYSDKIEKEKQSINIKHFEPGIYFLKFENEDEEIVRKVVIEN